MTNVNVENRDGFNMDCVDDEYLLFFQLNRILWCIRKNVHYYATGNSAVCDLFFIQSNSSIREILQKLVLTEKIIKFNLNAIINNTNNHRLRSARIDKDRDLDLIVPRICAQYELIITNIRSIKSYIDAEAVNRNKTAELSGYILKIAGTCREIVRKTQRLHEIVRITDAMIDPPMARCGIPELDALND